MLNLRRAAARLTCLLVGAQGAQFVHAAVETPAAVIAFSSNCLMGGTVGGRWIKAGEMAEKLKGGERYWVYGMDSNLGPATGEKPKPMAPENEPCRDTREVAVKPAPGKEASLAIGGQWNALPRPVKKEDNAKRTYRDLLSRFLKQNGIPSKDAQPSQTLLVDLDGDGTVEVLIGATKISGSPGAAAKAGDYSAVFLQQIVNGRTRFIPIALQYHPADKEDGNVERFRITGVLDVDGDGKMEIVVHGQHYEGDWTTVYGSTGEKLTELATCGCSI